MSEDAYWLAKTDGGWTVQDRWQIFAVHSTRAAALAHLDRLTAQDGARAQPLDSQACALPDIPRSDAFFRRFG